MLRRLGHCDSEGVIQLKGRVACEINTCDEMVVTELIFSGAFNDLTPEQSSALLSCMVHQVRPCIAAPSFSLVRATSTRMILFIFLTICWWGLVNSPQQPNGQETHREK